MPTETERRIDCVMAVLRDLQAEGLLPVAPLKPEGMAYVSQVIGMRVSASTFRRVEKRAIARAKERGLQLSRLALQAHLSKTRQPQS